MKLTLILLTFWISATAADDALSLKAAVRLALAQNQSVAAAAAERKAAASRITEARSASLPKVDYTESWARSDNPVFVFSSLLTQHQFGEQNFQIGPLNRPDFVNNFQSLLTADQTLYDGGRAAHAAGVARLENGVAGENLALTETEVIAQVTRAYFDALLSAEELDSATHAERSARADLDRAQQVRATGMSTDADVLSIRVHLADVEERRIRAAAGLEVARAALNDAPGLPLDTPHTLTTPLERVALPETPLAGYEDAAAAGRPEMHEAMLAVDLARGRAQEARSALLPEVTLHSAFEADRQRFYGRGGANWLVSLGMRWNIFDGRRDRARIDETKSQLDSAVAQEARAASAVRLEVRRAYADLRAAEERIEAAKAASGEAEESLRIVRNRYSAGMATVTDLLRTGTAALDARTRYHAAIHDQRIAAALLEMAAGKLTPDSEVLN